MDNPPLPFPDEWFPEQVSEDDTEVEYVEETSEIWRIVDKDGSVQWSYVAARFRKPYYSTYRGAKVALHYFPQGARIQKGEVSWSDAAND